MGEQLIDAEKVAEILGVKVSWVYRAAREETLPCVRAGRYVRFEPSAIEDYVRKGGQR